MTIRPTMQPSKLKPEQDHEEHTARFGRHKLDELDPERVAKHLVMFEPTSEDVSRILDLARLSIPGIAKTEEVLRVFRYSPICIMGLARKSKYDPQAPVAEGFVAILLLFFFGFVFFFFLLLFLFC